MESYEEALSDLLEVELQVITAESALRILEAKRWVCEVKVEKLKNRLMLQRPPGYSPDDIEIQADKDDKLTED